MFFALRNPFMGVLAFFWISFMNPHRYSYGFAYTFPFALIAAAVTLVSVLINFNELKFPKIKEAYLFIIFWLFVSLTTMFAIYPDPAWQKWVLVNKIFLMTLIAMLVITTRKRLTYFTLAIIIYIGFRGVSGAIFGILTGGQYKVWGPEDTFISDNNDIGLAFVMIVPLCFFIKNTLEKKWQSYGVLAIGVTSIIAAILTYSRGALVGLFMIGAMSILKSKHKFLIAAASFIVILIGIRFLPPNWFDRMNTIKTYQEDRSANQRINSWWFSYNLACNKFLGGGFECFEMEQYAIYAPNIELAAVSSANGSHVAGTAHSIYFEVLATQGFIGLAIYLSCLIAILMSLRRVGRISRYLPNAGWVAGYSRAFSVSIIGYMANGAFLSRAFFDLFWAIYAAAACLVFMIYTGAGVEMPETFERSS